MRLSVFTLLFLLASLAQATPGGLDASGCHHPRNKQFHCHVPRAKAQGKTQGRGETPAQREKRLLRECRGLPNAGACLGYANQAQGPQR